MAWVMMGLCLFAAALAILLAFVRWWRNPEYLRWLRIEQRARTRAAAQRASEKYAALPAVTVKPWLVPALPPSPAAEPGSEPPQATATPMSV